MQIELRLLVYASVVATIAGAFFFYAFHSQRMKSIVPTEVTVMEAPPSPEKPPVIYVADESPAPPATREDVEVRRRSVTFDEALADVERFYYERRERTGSDDMVRPNARTLSSIFIELEHPVVERNLRQEDPEPQILWRDPPRRRLWTR